MGPGLGLSLALIFPIIWSATVIRSALVALIGPRQRRGRTRLTRRTCTGASLRRLAFRGGLFVRPHAAQFLTQSTDLVVQLQHEFFQPLMLFGKPPILFQHHRMLRDVVVLEVAQERLRRLRIAVAKERCQRPQLRGDPVLLAVANDGQFNRVAWLTLGDGIGQVFRSFDPLVAGLDHDIATTQTGPRSRAARIHAQQMHALNLLLGLRLARQRFRGKPPHGDAQPSRFTLIALLLGARRGFGKLLAEGPLESRIERHFDRPLFAVTPDDHLGRVAFVELREGLHHGFFAVDLGIANGEQVVAGLKPRVIGRAAGPHILNQRAGGSRSQEHAKPHTFFQAWLLLRGIVLWLLPRLPLRLLSWVLIRALVRLLTGTLIRLLPGLLFGSLGRLLGARLCRLLGTGLAGLAGLLLGCLVATADRNLNRRLIGAKPYGDLIAGPQIGHPRWLAIDDDLGLRRNDKEPLLAVDGHGQLILANRLELPGLCILRGLLSRRRARFRRRLLLLLLRHRGRTKEYQPQQGT